jgi:hypothetical protein
MNEEMDMNSHETDTSAADAVRMDLVRRNAETLRSEQAVIILKGLFRLIGRLYARLSTHGALLNAPGRSSRGLF